MKTDEQIEVIANRVRDRWLNERHEAPTTPTTPTRPAHPQDFIHRAALNRTLVPMEYDLSREQRGRLKRLKQEVRNPDLTGLSGPSDTDYIEFPQLRVLQHEVETARKVSRR